MKTFQPTERTTLKRLPKRGVYDRDLVYQILDEGFICHVGFVVDVKRLATSALLRPLRRRVMNILRDAGLLSAPRTAASA